MPLTALRVKNTKPRDKSYKLADEKGLYLVVTRSGGKLWRFDYRHEDKRKTLAIGKWPDVDLASARERRDDARKRLTDGEDPADVNRAVEIAIENAFETVARNWHAAARTAWTPRYSRLVLGRLEADIFPHIGKDSIDSIEPPRLLEVIRKVEERGAIETAKRIKNYCSEIFMYGIAEGRCRRDPAADIRRALRRPKPKKHRAAVPPSEFPTLVARLHAYDGDELTRLALTFTLITMVRTQETRFARVNEFENLDGQEPL